MPLSGNWLVKLDSLNIGTEQKWFKSRTHGSHINLPGTLDDAGIGITVDTSKAEIQKDILYKLTRKHSYLGSAWYYKEIDIPADWRNKRVQLSLERVLWTTDLWIDGNFVGKAETLSTPQVFDVTPFLLPGKHFIALRIDNSKRHNISVKNLAHAYTEGTQIIWNGAIGELKLIAKDGISIETTQTYPDITRKAVDLSVIIKNITKSPIQSSLKIAVTTKDNITIALKHINVNVKPGNTEIKEQIALGENALLWDEFNPNLYNIKVSIEAPSAGFKDVILQHSGSEKSAQQARNCLLTIILFS